MKIRVLDLTVQDIERGRRFYDLQLPGLGGQFAKQLLADIEALLIHAGVHQQHFGYYRADPSSLAEALN